MSSEPVPFMKILGKKTFTQTFHINSQQLYCTTDVKFSKSNYYNGKLKILTKSILKQDITKKLKQDINKKYTFMKTDFTHFN